VSKNAVMKDKIMANMADDPAKVKFEAKKRAIPSLDEIALLNESNS